MSETRSQLRARNDPADTDDDVARRWLRQRLEWEELLHGLRQANGTAGRGPAAEAKPAAA